MGKTVIVWDGQHVPEELRQLPPGEYTLENLDDDLRLTPEEDRGIQEALNSLDAGMGKSLAEVIAEIRTGFPRK